ncbi:galactosylceramide sulfotransferase-like [Saccoglossus kowalevskii]|uniref:Galactosylceramide sulfotransferase-like n=1 Tax=Saccoglossus kowalevskii TaxID=10224 RepID=A0ABM0MEW9_SACKO|nr:PREDICTED: galactosylceramide sulfotransferase-like [Saccoglossus kowalevskii]
MTDDMSAMQCRSQSRFIFIKTMKTGGSTTANILMRYGLYNDLYAASYNIKYLYCSNFTGFDFMALHLRYNRTWMNNIIPDARYLTILRSPFSQLPSSFYYFKFAKPLLNYTDPFRQYIEHLDSYHDFTDVHHQHRNGQMWFLNPEFEDEDQDNVTIIQHAIRRIDKEMDFVIILDHFDESLVILKQIMCWKDEDIIYHISKKSRKRNTITTSMKINIRKWSLADTLLFEHFNRSLWDKVNNYDGDFNSDLKRFRSKNAKVSFECSRNKIHHVGTFCWKLMMDTPQLRKFAKQNEQYRRKTTLTELEQKCKKMT